MISVVIPCYNSEKFIKRTVESVLNQTYKDYEIILVDNNSSDNTISIINDYQSKHPDIITVLHEFKKGAPATRNKGLSEAKGNWIQFLDSDDELLPEKLEQQFEVTNRSTVDVIVGNSYIANATGDKQDKKILQTESDVWKGLLTSKLGITSANLWKRESVLAAGGWNENKNSSQEYDLLFRLLKNDAAIGFCSAPLTIVHINPDSISHSRNENKVVDILNNNITLRLEIKDYLKSKNKLTKELNQAADRYIYNILVSCSPLIPFKKGIIRRYVRKTLREIPLDINASSIIKAYSRVIVSKLKHRL